MIRQPGDVTPDANPHATPGERFTSLQPTYEDSVAPDDEQDWALEE